MGRGRGQGFLCVLGPWLSADEMESEMFWMELCWLWLRLSGTGTKCLTAQGQREKETMGKSHRHCCLCVCLFLCVFLSVFESYILVNVKICQNLRMYGWLHTELSSFYIKLYLICLTSCSACQILTLCHSPLLPVQTYKLYPLTKTREGFNVSCDAKLSMSVPDSFKRWRC